MHDINYEFLKNVIEIFQSSLFSVLNISKSKHFNILQKNMNGQNIIIKLNQSSINYQSLFLFRKVSLSFLCWKNLHILYFERNQLRQIKVPITKF